MQLRGKEQQISWLAKLAGMRDKQRRINQAPRPQPGAWSPEVLCPQGLIYTKPDLQNEGAESDTDKNRAPPLN